MARLQIVTLSTLKVGEVSQPEYLILLDEADDELVAEFLARPGFGVAIREATGSRGVLVFKSTIEVV